MATALYDPAGRLVGAVETIQDTLKEEPVKPPSKCRKRSSGSDEVTSGHDLHARPGGALPVLPDRRPEMGIDPAEVIGRTPHPLS